MNGTIRNLIISLFGALMAVGLFYFSLLFQEIGINNLFDDTFNSSGINFLNLLGFGYFFLLILIIITSYTLVAKFILKDNHFIATMGIYIATILITPMLIYGIYFFIQRETISSVEVISISLIFVPMSLFGVYLLFLQNKHSASLEK